MHKRIVDVQYVAVRIGVKALILWIQASFQHSSRQTGIIKFLKRSLKRSYSYCRHNLTAFFFLELWRNVAQNIKPHNVSVLKLTMIIHNLRKRKISRRNCPPQEAITARYVDEKRNTFHRYTGGHGAVFFLQSCFASLLARRRFHLFRDEKTAAQDVVCNAKKKMHETKKKSPRVYDHFTRQPHLK